MDKINRPDNELTVEEDVKVEVGKISSEELKERVNEVLKSEIPKIEKSLNEDKTLADINLVIPAKINFEGLKRTENNRNLQAFLKDLYKADEEWSKTENMKKYVKELNSVGDAFGSLSRLAEEGGSKE
jgi:uncharacterized membrane-anchored protein YjiN (DUF445 family)